MDKLLTGSALKHAISNPSIHKRHAFIEDFLFERDVLMIVSQAGLGKSICAMMVTGALSSGTSLFGSLEVTEPKRVYYLQLEGDIEEAMERLHAMDNDPYCKGFINADNIFWHEEKLLDIHEVDSRDAFIAGIHKSEFRPQVFIIDPIYTMLSRDLATGEAALLVVKFCNRLMAEFRASIILVHHTTKPVYDKYGNERMDYYGHSFIRNYIRTAYSIEQQERGILMKLTKSRGSDVLDGLSLIYNPETMTLTLDIQSGPVLERIRNFIWRLKHEERTSSFKEFVTNCSISPSHLRQLKLDGKLDEFLSFKHISRREAEIWIPR
jgi:hypothetical protein